MTWLQQLELFLFPVGAVLAGISRGPRTYHISSRLGSTP